MKDNGTTRQRYECVNGCGTTSPSSEWFCWSDMRGGWLCWDCHGQMYKKTAEARERPARRILRDLGLVDDSQDRRNGSAGPGPDEGWLIGSPMDPCAGPTEPLDLVPGFPFMHPAMAAVVSGPSGKGRSATIQACAYDAAVEGQRVLYLGGEVTRDEFNDRARRIAKKRGDDPEEVRRELSRARYVDLSDTLAKAWKKPAGWIKDVGSLYDVLVIDPLNDALAAVRFGHENADYVNFYKTLIEPLRNHGVAVVLLDNIGHAEDTQTRPLGPSSKINKADLMFACKAEDDPPRLRITATKVRSMRAVIRVGMTWECRESTLELVPIKGLYGTPDKPPTRRERLREALREGVQDFVLLRRSLREGDDNKILWTQSELAEALGEEPSNTTFRGAVDDLVGSVLACTGTHKNKRYSPHPALLSWEVHPL